MYALILLAFSGVDTFDLIGLRQEVAELKARVAALEAKAATKSGSVAVTKAIEVYSPPVKPGPVKQAVTAAAKVATAPAKVLQRVCDGGVCRMVEVDAVPNYSESPNSCQACQGGSCYRPQRRGWFGRRR